MRLTSLKVCQTLHFLLHGKFIQKLLKIFFKAFQRFKSVLLCDLDISYKAVCDSREDFV